MIAAKRRRPLDPDFEAYLYGTKMSRTEAEALEAELALKPDSETAREKLLGFYALKAHKNKDDYAARMRHIEWLIRNRPDLQEGISQNEVAKTGLLCTPKDFGKLRELWLDALQVQPGHPKVLGSAGMFISARDFETGEPLLRGALASEPGNTTWAHYLCHFSYWVFIDALDRYKRTYALKTLDYGARLMSLGGGSAPFLAQRYVGECAVYLEDFDRCLEVGAWMETELRDSPLSRIGSAFLGHALLAKNDIDGALSSLDRTLFGDQETTSSMWAFAKTMFKNGYRKEVIACVERNGGGKRQDWLRMLHNGVFPPDVRRF